MAKRYVQVISQFAGNYDEPPLSNYKVIFVGVVENNLLERQSAFGIAHDAEGRFPFELEPPLNGRPHGALYFGSGHEVQRERTNLFDCPIEQGNLYTRWIRQNSEEIEQPYRIMRIIDL
jgi:hypothetical protein